MLQKVGERSGCPYAKVSCCSSPNHDNHSHHKRDLRALEAKNWSLACFTSRAHQAILTRSLVPEAILQLSRWSVANEEAPFCQRILWSITPDQCSRDTTAMVCLYEQYDAMKYDNRNDSRKQSEAKTQTLGNCWRASVRTITCLSNRGTRLHAKCSAGLSPPCSNPSDTRITCTTLQ